MTTASGPVRQTVAGRVTDFLSSKMQKGAYAFYLCGRGGMILDVVNLADEKFPGSRIFSERFFS